MQQRIKNLSHHSFRIQTSLMSQRFALLIELIFCLNVHSLCQSAHPKKNAGYWHITDVKGLQTGVGVLSNQVLKEIEQHNKNLKKLIGHTLYYKDSRLFFEKSIQGLLYSSDTIFFKIMLKYEIGQDDRSTIKYPGDELSDTLTVNRQIGKTFINMLSLKNSKYLKVLIGEDPKNKLSVYRLCEISKNKIGLVLLDQGILLICSSNT